MTRDAQDPVANLERHSVVFWLREGETLVSCQVSFMGLSDKLEGRRIVTAAQAMAAFAQHRDEIEAIARKKHSDGRVEPNGSIFVASGDLAAKGWFPPT